MHSSNQPGNTSANRFHPSLIWDEKHVKALLGLRRYPFHMIQTEPRRAWLNRRGGNKRVVEHLLAAPLSVNQKQLLEIILAHPDGSSVFYAGKLHLGQSAYFMRLDDLAQALARELNAWEVDEPLLSAALFPTNLPAPLTPLVGAEETSATLIAILHRPGVRLLTLLGPGGVGKTRLAIEVGTRLRESFSDGVFFVPLETVNDPALLPSQVARSLNLDKVGAHSLLDALKSYLRERQALLVLDNFEQLIEAGSIVVELLQAAAKLKVLVTSREPLNQYGETRFIVPELARPDPNSLPPIDQLEQWAAVDLFVQRVRALHPTFALNQDNMESVARICHRLDGLPLAIELAAAQVKLLTPTQELPHLEDGLKSLKDTSRDRPTRQRTLWNAIDWSYQLLLEPEKALFRQLAVFGRAWDLKAAESVCEMGVDVADGLDELANKSLVRYAVQRNAAVLRFEMLQAVREYALDQLRNSGEYESTQHRHALYYLMFVEQAEGAIGSPGQLDWAKRILQEHENLQIALQSMLDAKETELAFRLLGAVWRYWDMLNVWSEARLWMERALAQGAGLQSAGRAATLWGASWLAAHHSDYPLALSYAKEGLALAREIGEKRLVARLLQSVADGLYRLGQHEQSIVLVEESLHILRELDDREEIAWALDHLARGLWERGERARSREILSESLALFRSMGHEWAIAYSLSHLGRLALDDNDNDVANTLLAESLALSKKMGAKQRISEVLRALGLLTWRSGDFDQAKAILLESLALSREVGDRTGEGWALNRLGCMALEQADFVTARRLFEETQALFQRVGEPAAILWNLDCLKRLELAEKGQR
jgi:predicted ATPase